MDRQGIAERLKWLAVELELGRPNWPEILRASVDLIHQAHPLAEGQYARCAGKVCPRCGAAS